MLKRLPLAFILLCLSACSTPKFIGKSANNYTDISCPITQEDCTIRYVDSGYITYSVSQTGLNTYRVSGNVDLNMDIVGGMRPRVSFYIIFMDEYSVQQERRVKTGTRKATFDFEINIDSPVFKTSVEKMTFHTWS